MFFDLSTTTLSIHVLLVLPALTLAATPQPVSLNSSQLCPANTTLNAANASGTVLFFDETVGTLIQSDNISTTPWYLGSSSILNDSLTRNEVASSFELSWSMSINKEYALDENNVSSPGLDTTLWLGAPPLVNLYDGSNSFSGCAFVFTDLPENTIRRGQSDVGDCQATLDRTCIDALTKVVSESAFYLVANPTGGLYSNLTPPVLDYVCNQIQQDIGTFNSRPSGGTTSTSAATFPKECIPYFKQDNPSGNSPAVSQMQGLTSNTTTSLDNSTCFDQSYPLLPSYTLRNLWHTWDFLTNDTATNDAIYDNVTRAIYPVLSVWFPQANISRVDPYTASSGTAEMTCLRANKFSKDSRIPPALPAPTAVDLTGYQSTASLGTGAKVGIAVGCVVAAVLLSIAVGFWWRRRKDRKLREQQAAAAAAAGKTKSLDDSDGGAQWHELTDSQRNELHGGGGGAGRGMHEMKGSTFAPAEVHGRDVKEAEGSAVATEMDGRPIQKRIDGVLEMPG